jgi:hypothetical protein
VFPHGILEEEVYMKHPQVLKILTLHTLYANLIRRFMVSNRLLVHGLLDSVSSYMILVLFLPR